MDKIRKYQDRFLLEKVYNIDYYDLDQILLTEYGLDSDKFTTALDQDNMSILRINVHGRFNKFDESNLQQFLEDHEQDWNTVYLLLNDLCRNGHIDAGTYLIDISW